jgi:Na+-driven multidrug efflux pump
MSRLVRMGIREFLSSGRQIRQIISLGLTSFVMQFTNSLVSVSCNSVLSRTGGDVYVSVMTIISSVRQLMDTPILAIADGASPVISFNYGAGKPKRVRHAIRILTILCFSYTLLAWIFIILRSDLVIGIFTSDREILKDAMPSLHIYFFAFVFQTFQYTGQSAFKALGKSRQAIFFSLLRKVVIVVPLTFLLPYAFHMGTKGVFMAEPVSNVIGGLACYLTMIRTVFPELRRMESKKA